MMRDRSGPGTVENEQTILSESSIVDPSVVVIDDDADSRAKTELLERLQQMNESLQASIESTQTWPGRTEPYDLSDPDYVPKAIRAGYLLAPANPSSEITGDEP